MEIDRLLPVSDRRGLRKWLMENCLTASSCWVLTTLTSGPDAILYLDAVEEALCFGWIDSTRKTCPDQPGILAQRLSPRVEGSKWSELNKERVRRLEKLGLMTDAGHTCLPDMRVEAFEPDSRIMEALLRDSEAYGNFMKFPRLYRHVRLDTIQIKRNIPGLFQSRLEKLILNSKANKMYGDWNDGGRLLNY